MLTLLVVVFVALAVGLFIWAEHASSIGEGQLVGGIISTIITAILIISICCIAPDVACERTLDAKIAMYEEENAKIEQKVDDVVNNYITYEQNTLKELRASNNDSMSLATIIPGLNSNTLVQQQITLYNENKQKITDLKVNKINLSTYRWLLYFGK